MPVHPTYPGVYIEEIPSGVRPVTAVATSIAAFVGTFRKGPRDEALRILSMADFERNCGGIERTSEASYGVQQFFVNGGTEAWIVRIANDGSGGDIAAAPSALTLEDTAGTAMFRAQAGRRLRGEPALDPGEWGDNIRIEVDYDTADPATLFNLTVSEVRIDGNRTSVVSTETYRNLTLESDVANNALEVVNHGSLLVQLDLNGATPGATDRPAPTGTLTAALLSPIPAAGDILASVNLELELIDDPTVPSTFTLTTGDLDFSFLPSPAPFPGQSSAGHYRAWAQALQEAIRRAARDATFQGDANFRPEHRDYLAGATVSLIGSGTAANPFRFAIRTGRTSRPFDHTAELRLVGTNAGNYGMGAGAFSGPQLLALDGGEDGTVLDATGAFVVPVSVFQGSAALKTGFFALEDVDLFNILCVPQAALYADALDMRAVYAAAEDYVEDRRAMLIVDISPNVTRLDQMETWLADNESLRHPNAVVYFPRTNVADPLNQNRPRSLAASATIAGLYARTDSQRGVWKAPAGTDARLRNVDSLTYLLTDRENGVLNPLGVNCLRNFPVYSNICWGARTLEGADVIASDWKYVPVRRTTLFIEESLFRGTKWVVFEPNDEPLWSQIRLNVGAFMQDLFRKGAFQGTTPREAYFVKCDLETTTQTDIDNGIVNIEVGFAPLKPAEFVILKIQQIVRRPEA
jgi:phage tail sheath protein FI